MAPEASLQAMHFVGIVVVVVVVVVVVFGFCRECGRM